MQLDEGQRELAGTCGIYEDLVEDEYDDAFYKKHERWKSDYEAIAGVLGEYLVFSTVLDVGCGNGYIIEELYSRGRVVRGIEGSPAALKAIAPTIREMVTLHDLKKPICLGHFDLVICTEVAEHLRPENADTVVETICIHNPRYIFFTAATPGQNGRFHRNEQPHSYWAERFALRKYLYSEDVSFKIRGRLAVALRHAKWIARNTMIFARDPGLT